MERKLDGSEWGEDGGGWGVKTYEKIPEDPA
jgi:hypothetical protein